MPLTIIIPRHTVYKLFFQMIHQFLNRIPKQFKCFIGFFNTELFAENVWKYLGSTNLGDFFYDSSSILKHDDFVVISSYTNITDIRRQGKPLSSKNLVKINCRDKSAIITKPVYYDGFDLNGSFIGANPKDVNSNDRYEKIPQSGSPLSILYAKFCI